MHDCGLSVCGFYTLISDTDQGEVIGSVQIIPPNIGAKPLDGALGAQGIIVQRSRIKGSLVLKELKDVAQQYCTGGVIKLNHPMHCEMFNSYHTLT